MQVTLGLTYVTPCKKAINTGGELLELLSIQRAAPADFFASFDKSTFTTTGL